VKEHGVSSGFKQSFFLDSLTHDILLEHWELGCCDHSNESLGFIMSGEFLD
jgi:hypothetical protein